MRVIWIIVFISFFIIGPQAQENPSIPDVTENDFENLRKELGYDKTKRALVLRDEYKSRPQERQPQRSYSGPIFLFKMIAYLLVGLLVIGVIYLVFSNVKIDRDTAVGELEEEEYKIEDIEEIDADALYKQAVANQNYRVAIRMLFIKTLQKLEKKEYIEWTVDKTNRDFYREISNASVKGSFREVSTIYERVWYGDTELDRDSFRNFDQRFLHFLNTIG